MAQDGLGMARGRALEATTCILSQVLDGTSKEYWVLVDGGLELGHKDGGLQ